MMGMSIKLGLDHSELLALNPTTLLGYDSTVYSGQVLQIRPVEHHRTNDHINTSSNLQPSSAAAAAAAPIAIAAINHGRHPYRTQQSMTRLSSSLPSAIGASNVDNSTPPGLLSTWSPPLSSSQQQQQQQLQSGPPGELHLDVVQSTSPTANRATTTTNSTKSRSSTSSSNGSGVSRSSNDLSGNDGDHNNNNNSEQQQHHHGDDGDGGIIPGLMNLFGLFGVNALLKSRSRAASDSGSGLEWAKNALFSSSSKSGSGTQGDEEQHSDPIFDQITSPYYPSARKKSSLSPLLSTRQQQHDEKGMSDEDEEDDSDSDREEEDSQSEEKKVPVSTKAAAPVQLRGTEQGSVLDQDQIQHIADALPLRYRNNDWGLVYSLREHGASINTLYRRALDLQDGPGILNIQTSKRHLFGAFITETLEDNKSLKPKYYGTGECFVFTFQPEYQVFRWNNRREPHFIHSTAHCLCIGERAIFIRGSLESGSTHECPTFGNPPLCPSEDFNVYAVELWAPVKKSSDLPLFLPELAAQIQREKDEELQQKRDWISRQQKLQEEHAPLGTERKPTRERHETTPPSS